MSYRAEVQISGVSVTGAAPPAAFFTDVTRAAVAFSCQHASNAGKLFGIVLWLLTDSDDISMPPTEYSAQFEPRYGSAPDAMRMTGLLGLTGGPTPSRIRSQSGTNGAAYFNGGTLAIEKDDVAQTVTWISPLANATVSWADLLPFVVEPGPLLANSFGHFIQPPSAASPASEVAVWKNFYSLADGVRIQGADLSLDDPGTWNTWSYDPSFPFGPPAENWPTDDQQQLDGYQTKFDLNPNIYNPLHGSGEYRLFEFNPIRVGRLDMCRSKEDCLLWELSVPPYMPHTVMLRRTENNGRGLWKQIKVYRDNAKVWSDPSISYWSGGLTAVWSDGGTTYTSLSYTIGDTWTMPTTLPYAGTNPRHVTEWTSGFTLYFFFDGSNLMVARTSDHGHSFWDPAPLLVRAATAPQQIDADFAFDGSIVLTFFETGVWMQTRSWDMGSSWS